MYHDLMSVYVHGLTTRQREVVYWVAQGLSNEEVAQRLCVQPASVAEHLTVIYQTLGNLEHLADRVTINRSVLINQFAVFFYRHPELAPLSQ